MESIMATDMTGNVNAWCSLQDQKSTDWREQCRFFLCTFLQLVSSTASYCIEELNKALSGRNVKDLSTDDLQIKLEHTERELVLVMLLGMFSFILFLRLDGHKNDCVVRVIRTRWWVSLSLFAEVGLMYFHLSVRNSKWLLSDGYESISLLLGFDSRDLIIPSCYVVHSLTTAVFLGVNRRCSCSSPKTYTYTDIWSTINQCISFLREYGAQILAVFNMRIVSSTSITHRHTTRPEPHTWSKQFPFMSFLRGRGAKHEFNPSFMRPLSTRKLIGKRPSSLESALNLEFSKRRKLNDTASRRDDPCDDSDLADALSCFASKAKDADGSAEVLTESGSSSSPDAGSRRGNIDYDSYEDVLSCFATSTPNCSDEKDADVLPYSSRSSSPDTDFRREYTGDVSFATKADSSGDEADVSADTTSSSSRSSSPDTDARVGRCGDDNIPAAAAAAAASWGFWPSTYDDDDNREVSTEVAYASQNVSSADSDLRQEDVSGSLQETASLCSSSTSFRPIRHDDGQGCTLCIPGPSSRADDYQVCEETDENICSSRGRATEFCSPLIPCTKTNSRTEDKPHCVVPGSSGDSSASVVPNCGSDYASDSGSSGESIFTVTKYSMGTKRYLLPSISFDSRSLSASVVANCRRDCSSGSSDDSIFKGNECSMGIEQGIDKLLKRRPLSTRKLIGKRPSGLKSALN